MPHTFENIELFDDSRYLFINATINVAEPHVGSIYFFEKAQSSSFVICSITVFASQYGV